MTNIREQIIELHNDGKNKGQIEGYLRYAHDLSVNEAKELVGSVFEEHGIASAVQHANHKETVRYLREHYGKLDKKELINGMCDVNGKTYKTNQHAYNYIAMMIEWAKQELES